MFSVHGLFNVSVCLSAGSGVGVPVVAGPCNSSSPSQVWDLVPYCASASGTGGIPIPTGATIDYRIINRATQQCIDYSSNTNNTTNNNTHLQQTQQLQLQLQLHTGTTIIRTNTCQTRTQTQRFTIYNYSR